MLIKSAGNMRIQFEPAADEGQNVRAVFERYSKCA